MDDDEDGKGVADVLAHKRAVEQDERVRTAARLFVGLASCMEVWPCCAKRLHSCLKDMVASFAKR